MLDYNIPSLDEQEEERRRRERFLRFASGEDVNEPSVREDNVFKAAGRGAVNAVAETVDTATEIGQGILRGANNLGRKYSGTGVGVMDMAGYSDDDLKMENPFSAGLRNLRDEYLGADESNGFFGLVEGITQFSVGMAGLGKLRGVGLSKALGMTEGAIGARATTALEGAGRLGQVAAAASGPTALRGAVVDFAAFDPHEKRLSNIVQDWMPEFMRDAVITAAESDDSALVGRAKQTLEGFLMGSTIDLLIAGLRASKAKAAKDGAAFNQALTDAENAMARQDGYQVVQRQSAAAEATAEARVDAPTTSVEAKADDAWEPATGSVSRGPREDAFDVLDPEGNTIATAPTREAAESMASSHAYESRVSRIQFNDEMVERIRNAARAAVENKDLEGAIAEIGDVNPRYLDMDQDAMAWTYAISHEVREVMHGGRHAQGLDFKSLTEDAERFLRTEGLDGDIASTEWLNNITEAQFGKAEEMKEQLVNAASAMLGYRIARAKATEAVKFWSRKVALTPSDAIANSNLTKAIQVAADFHFKQADLGAGFGGGLNSRKIAVNGSSPLSDAGPGVGTPQAGTRGRQKLTLGVAPEGANGAALKQDADVAADVVDASKELRDAQREIDEVADDMADDYAEELDEVELDEEGYPDEDGSYGGKSNIPLGRIAKLFFGPLGGKFDPSKGVFVNGQRVKAVHQPPPGPLFKKDGMSIGLAKADGKRGTDFIDLIVKEENGTVRFWNEETGEEMFFEGLHWDHAEWRNPTSAPVAAAEGAAEAAPKKPRKQGEGPRAGRKPRERKPKEKDETIPSAEERRAFRTQRGTVAIRATDFSRARIARAVKRVEAVLEKAGEESPPLPPEIAQLGITARSSRILDESAEGRGLKKPESQPREKKGNPIEALSRWLDAADDQLDAAFKPRAEKAAEAFPSLIGKDSPLSGYRKWTQAGEREMVNAGRNVQKALDFGKRYLRDMTDDELEASAKELRELRQSGMTLSAPEMRSFARMVATMTDDKDLDFIYEGLTSFWKKQVADGASPTPRPDNPTTVFRGENSLWNRTEGQGYAKVRNFALGYRMNALLSGAKTQLTNMVSGLANSLYLPVERALAGVYAGDAAKITESWHLLTGIAHNLSESMTMAKAAFADGRDFLDAYHGERNATLPAWQKASWPLRLLQLPSRLLMTSDEFFKQLAYRNSVRAQSLMQSMADIASKPKNIPEAQWINERLESDLRAAFNNGMVEPQFKGAAVNPKALRFAREVTFTSPMEEGMAKNLLQMVEKRPELRLFVPFVRIPANIMRFQFDRFPGLAFVAKRNRDALLAGGEKRAEVMARQTMGATFFGFSALLASNGQITGRGPSDPALRDEWLRLGYRPYSIKVGNKWFEYRRLEPFASPLGFVADLRDVRSELDDDSADEAITAGIAAFANFTFSKTYMKGLSDLFDALGRNDPRKVERLLQNLVGSFVPNALNQANPDPYLREVNGYMDEVMSRIPGFSTMLEPRRNFFGEPVRKPGGYVNRSFNPFISGAMFSGEDAWLGEVVRLGENVGMPDRNKFGMDLTDRSVWTRKDGKAQSPYDRWMELIGRPADGMMPLKDALQSLVESEAWKNVPAGTEDSPGGTRIKLLRRLVDTYQRAAWQRVQDEYQGPGGVPMRDLMIQKQIEQRMPGGYQPQMTGRYGL